MPALPWTTSPPPEPQAELLVLGSRLTLQSYRHTFAFLRAALKIRRQVLDSPGAVGVSLIAQPTRKTFWTLSAWTDQAALDTFVRTSPHTDVMRRFHGRLRNSLFTTWKVSSADLPATRTNAKHLWRDAKQRLATIARPA